MNDLWTDRLSEYLDGDLPPAEARELAAHLETCPACSAALEDLRDVVSRARGLRELDASLGVGSDLWPGIEARIRDLPVSTVRPVPERSDRESWWRRAIFNVPQLALASLAVAAVTVAILQPPGMWFGDRGRFARRDAASRGVPAMTASTEAARAAFSEIDRLKQALDSRRDQLDPDTFRSLEESVKSVEEAVQQASRALDADPENPYLKSHLEELKANQLHLLRRAVALAGGAE